jgi:DNA topoisomerase-3
MEKASVDLSETDEFLPENNEDSSNPKRLKTQLGTPATRAGIIEKLISTKFIERNKKQLLPTEKGINLIAVVPTDIKSPRLTAEWEACLTEIEHGEKNFDEFLDEIKHMTKELVFNNKSPVDEFKSLFPQQTSGNKGNKKEVIGICPRCGSDVLEWDKVFSCVKKECEFALFKQSRYFVDKRVKLTKTIAKSLLKDGKVFIKELYSSQKNKTYSATVVLKDDGGKYVSFGLEF